MTGRFVALATFALAALASAPGLATAASLSVPRAIVLGLTDAVDLTLQVSEAAGDEARPLRLAVNVGRFEEPVRVGAGVYRALYRPPATLFPQVALVAVWREGGLEAPVEVLRLPLTGRTRVPVGALPGTELTVRVGDYSYGPVVVGPTGVEQVPLVVPPGVREAEVVARNHRGQLSRRRIPVEVPDYSRMVAVTVPHAVRADGRSQARVEVFYDSAVPIAAEDVQVAASAGTVTLVQARSGHFTYSFLPPPAPQTSLAELLVTARNDPASRCALGIELVLPNPARLAISAPSAPIPADGRSVVPVEVRLLDAEGLGLAGFAVRLVANGAAVPVEDAGEGLYRATLRAPLAMPLSRAFALEARLEGGAEPLLARHEVRLVPSAVPASIRVVARPALVPADGRAGPRFAFEVRDNSDRPVLGAALSARLSHGEIGPVRELGGGRYEVSFRPPAEPPPGGELQLRVADPQGALEQTTAVPVRPDPGRLLLGLRVGYFHSLATLHGPRAGLGATLRLGPVLVELLGSVAEARQRVRGAGWSSESRALFVPIVLRGAYELFASPDWSVVAGAGAVASWARVSNDLAGSSSRVGYGATAFASVARQLGPGQAFVDLSYLWAPVRAASFDLQSGGIGLEAGYRVRVF
ncbi:MAG TPA: hypothetical protein VGK67_02105 [Myxococcales bacterium]|jgi:hypothetical protein